MEKITLQRAFDAAWNAFVVNDGQPALSESGACRYLTEDGRKCAIGLLIPDGHPSLRRLGGVRALHASYPELFPEDTSEQELDRLADLQSGLHDALTTDSGWRAMALTQGAREAIYRKFAESRGLKVPGEG